MTIRTVARPPAGNVAFPPTSPPTFRGGSSFRGVLDGLEITSSRLGAWSVARRLRMPYVGPVIRLRRSSDSAERDFYGIGPQGEVSTSDVRAWNGWNLFSRTAELANAAWDNNDGGLVVGVVDGIADAFGGTTASRLTPAAGTGSSFIAQNRDNYTSGATYTLSLDVKANGCDFLQLAGSTGFSTADWRNFNLATGSVGNGSGTSAYSMTSLGNGWFRIQMSFVAGASALASRIIIAIYKTNVASRLAATDTFNGTDGVIVARPQFERALAFSTYEPRTTTAAGDSFLVTLYDQSGLARHFTQSTTTLQPIICEQGVPVTENGRLAAKFVAADARRMSIASSTAMFNALHTTGGSILLVSKANDTAAAKQILRNYNSSTGSGFELRRATTERFDFFAQRIGGAVPSAGQSITVNTSDGASTSQSVAAFLIDPDNATAALRFFAWQNGASLTGANAQTGDPAQENAQANLTLGASPAGGEGYDGTISEAAAFSALISTADRTTYQSRSGNFFTVSIA